MKLCDPSAGGSNWLNEGAAEGHYENLCFCWNNYLEPKKVKLSSTFLYYEDMDAQVDGCASCTGCDSISTCDCSEAKERLRREKEAAA